MEEEQKKEGGVVIPLWFLSVEEMEGLGPPVTAVLATTEGKALAELRKQEFYTVHWSELY